MRDSQAGTAAGRSVPPPTPMRQLHSPTPPSTEPHPPYPAPPRCTNPAKMPSPAFALSTSLLPRTPPHHSTTVRSRPVALPLSHPRPRRAHLSPPAMAATSPSPSPAPAPAAAPPATFDWRNRWYPILWAEDFDASQPYAFTLWDRALVMFRDAASGAFAVLDDRCPHRAAPLSEGRVYTPGGGATVLECGYHGWTYGCDGACVRVPQTEVPGEEVEVPRAADVPPEGVYRTAVRAGIVFVWFGEEEPSESVGLPEWFEKGVEDGSVMPFRNQTRLLEYDFLTFQESMLRRRRVTAASFVVGGCIGGMCADVGFLLLLLLLAFSRLFCASGVSLVLFVTFCRVSLGLPGVCWRIVCALLFFFSLHAKF